MRQDVPMTHLGKRVIEPSSAPLYTGGPPGRFMVPGGKKKIFLVFLFSTSRGYVWLREVICGHSEVICGHLKALNAVLFVYFEFLKCFNFDFLRFFK